MDKLIQLIPACCAPVAESALAPEEAADLAAAFKLLADPTRLRLLSIVATAEAGEVCACDLPAVLGVSQPTVSHHLKSLTEAGLLAREQRGKWAWYTADRDAMRALGEVLA